MKPMVTHILPVNPNALEQLVPAEYSQKKALKSGDITEYSPSAYEVMNYLINTYLNGMVYGILTEAYAS